MKLKEEERKQLKEIMSEMSCKRNFECYKCKFENCCDGKLVGEDFVKCEGSNSKCSAEKSQSCDFSVSFGYDFFLQMPYSYICCKEF
jgi:hypothetical protein